MISIIDKDVYLLQISSLKTNPALSRCATEHQPRDNDMFPSEPTIEDLDGETIHMTIKIGSWKYPRKMWFNNSNIGIEVKLDSCAEEYGSGRRRSMCEHCERRKRQVQALLLEKEVMHDWDIWIRHDASWLIIHRCGRKGDPIQYLAKLFGERIEKVKK